jgi:hypothetical protein
MFVVFFFDHSSRSELCAVCVRLTINKAVSYDWWHLSRTEFIFAGRNLYTPVLQKYPARVFVPSDVGLACRARGVIWL